MYWYISYEKKYKMRRITELELEKLGVRDRYKLRHKFAEDRDTRIQSDFNVFNTEDALEFASI